MVERIVLYKIVGKYFILLLIMLSTTAMAQRGGSQELPLSSKQAAPFDMSGYWVSVITEDWRYRMMAAEQGDVGAVPLNQAGRELAEAWNPSENYLESCLAFGGAGILRYPGRLHISWEDEEILRIDFSAGGQSRLLYFNDVLDAESMASSLQGYTNAMWYKEQQTQGLGLGRRPVTSFEGGNLQSETRNLSPAFLYRNGVPYSDQATTNDYYRVIDTPNGDRWLIITSIVSDPVYLQQDWITSTNFKYESNGDNWNPIACR